MRKLVLAIFLFSSAFNSYCQEPVLAIPTGHGGSMGPTFYSPDGKFAALTGFRSEMLIVMDMRLGRSIAVFQDTLAYYGFNNVQFSKDSRYLLTRSEITRLWDVEQKKPILAKLVPQTEEEDPDLNFLGAFDTSGRLLVYQKENNIAIFDIPARKQVGLFSPSAGELSSISCTPDGKYICLGTDEGFQFYKTKGYSLAFELHGLDHIYYASHGTAMAATDSAGVYIFDSITNKYSKKITVPEVSSITWRPDGQQLLLTASLKLGADSFTKEAYLYNLDGKMVQQWKDISEIAFADNAHIVVSDPQPTPGEYSGEEEEDILSARFTVYKIGIPVPLRSWLMNYYSIDFTPDGKRLVEATLDQVKIYNSKTGNLLQEWNFHGDVPGYEFDVSGDNHTLITSGLSTAVWNAGTGMMINAQFLKTKEDDYTSIIYSANKKIFIAKNDGAWQVWNVDRANVLISSPGYFEGNVTAALANDGRQAAFAYQNDSVSRIEIYDVTKRALVKQYDVILPGIRKMLFSPDGSKLFIASEDSTELRSIDTFRFIDRFPGMLVDHFSYDGKKFATTEGDSFIWDIRTGKRIRQLVGDLLFSPVGDKVLMSTGSVKSIYETVDDRSEVSLKKFWDYYHPDNCALSFSSDGKRIIMVLTNTGNAGYPDASMVWDARTGALVFHDAEGLNFNYASTTGRKVLEVTLGTDMTVMDLDSRRKTLLKGSADADWINDARFSPDDRYLYIYTGSTIKKWELSTGRLLLTFFPLDTSSYLAITPQGYYSCSPNAARFLHYIQGMKVVGFEQLDVRYNRPDKVLEYLHSPDSLLISAYHRSWIKRVKKIGIDTAIFRQAFSAPEADFINRESVSEETDQEKQVLCINADDVKKLKQFNVWINEVPLFGSKGLDILNRRSTHFDTTITVILSQGRNRIETSVRNIEGVESLHLPLLVYFTPVTGTAKTPQLHFIGIGIDSFLNKDYNLSWTVKDIRDLAGSFKTKWGDRCKIDTLFNTNVTVENVRRLKDTLLTTGVNDKVVVVFSGHGLLSKVFDYFLSTYAVDFNDPAKNGLPYDELENLVDSIPARQKLLLIDACHSGEVDKEDMVMLAADSSGLVKGLKPVGYKTEGQFGLKNSFELMQSLFLNVGKSTGATIISAATGVQFALERSELKNGIFSYSILEAMNEFPVMKVSMLRKIVSKRVEELTNGIQQPTSRTEPILTDWDVW